MEEILCTPKNLLEVERRGILGSPSILLKVSFISRVRAVDWIYSVHLNFKYQPGTFFAACNIIDAYFSRKQVTDSEHIQLVAISSLFLAAKYLEVFPDTISNYVYMTSDIFSKNEIIQMEKDIFITLGCNINVPVDINYLKTICITSGSSPQLYNTCKTVLSIVGVFGIEYLPSLVVTSIVDLVSDIYGEPYNNIFNMRDNAINICSNIIINICRAARSSPTRSTEEALSKEPNKKYFNQICDRQVTPNVGNYQGALFQKKTYFVKNIPVSFVENGIIRNPLLQKLGQGTYGVVKKVEYQRKWYAVKIISDNPDADLTTSFLREVSIITSLKHDNVIKTRHITYDLTGVFIDLALEDLTAWSQTNMATEKLQIKFADHMFSALKYIHEEGCIHRDIKPNNILVFMKEGSPWFVLADFGLSRGCEIPIRDNSFTHPMVTLQFRSPELLLGSKTYSDVIDVWSMGCTLFEYATGVRLFSGQSEVEQMLRIFSILGTPTEDTWKGVTKLPHYISEFPQWKPRKDLYTTFPSLSQLYVNLLQHILILDPSKRPSSSFLYDTIINKKSVDTKRRVSI